MGRSGCRERSAGKDQNTTKGSWIIGSACWGPSSPPSRMSGTLTKCRRLERHKRGHQNSPDCPSGEPQRGQATKSEKKDRPRGAREAVRVCSIIEQKSSKTLFF